jgi:adenosine deaminase
VSDITAAARRDLLRRLPKAELHCHLDGSVRPETIVELAREYRITLPAPDADALREYMLVDDARNLEEYLQRFVVTLSVMQTADALERVAFELAEDAAREGVRYIEVRYAPILNIKGGLSLVEAVEAPLRGLARARRDHGITGRVIVCALRNLPASTSLDLARLAVDCQRDGVVGFDLAGGERGFPAADHLAAFQHAQEHGMHCTCHAGEGFGAASVRQAVDICGAERVGHATRLAEDEGLVDQFRRTHVALEICLTSNVQTKAVESFETHPLRDYYDRGLDVVLNTDNRLMSGVTLTDEYVRAAEHLDFTVAELCDIARTGFERAFLPDAERAELLAAVTPEIEAIAREAEGETGHPVGTREGAK